MSRIIEAKAVISAEDRTGKAFDSIARKFKDVGKGAKVSAEVGKLAKQLDAAQAGLKNIDRFRSTQASFNQARAAYRGTQAEVARIAKELDVARKAASAFDGVKSFSKNGAMAAEMAAARKQVTELERQFTATQRAVKASSNAYEAQAVAIKGAKREAEASGLSVGKLVAEQARLKAAVEGTSAAILKQATLERSGHSLTAGMGAVGRQQADRIAAGRRLTEGMGAPARAEREARAREEHEARQAELRRRASASGDLISGMGSVGRRTAEHIDQGRRLTDGMGAPARAAAEERERRAMEVAETRAQRRADRRDAAGTVAAGTSLYLGHKGKEIGIEAIDKAARFDYAVRYQHAVTDVTEDDQKRLLIPQAKRIGQETKFSNEDIVEAQTATMQGLPFKDPAMKAQVGSAIVDNARYYAVLFKASMEKSSEGIRNFLQNTNKDISTPEKAVGEAQRATNLIVKAAKLGGASDDDAQMFMKFGLPQMTQAGFKDTTAMSIFATARRSGLKGDEAGVFGRAAASKLISPTREGREAEIVAGIDRSKYQKMPEQLSAEAFEKIGKGRFGVKFNESQKGRLSGMFRDGDLVTDQQEFVKQVSDVVGESFDKVRKGPNKGKVKAQDAAKIAKLASDFYRMSVESTDVEGLWNAHLNSPTFTAALRNKFYTDKHGGKFGMIGSHGDQFREDRDQLEHVTQTPAFAKEKADYLTKGLGGSIDNLKGSYETAVLNLGTKNAPVIQAAADGIAAFGDAIANTPDKTVQAGSALAAVAASGASAASTLAILGKLTGSSILTGLAGAGAAAMLPVIGAGAAAGVLYAGSDESKGLVHGGRPDIQMNPGDELPGLEGSTVKPSWVAPAKVEPNRPSVADGVPSLIDAGRKSRSAAVDEATKALASYRQELEALKSEMSGLSDLGLPGVGAGQDGRRAALEAQIQRAEERLKSLKQSAPPVEPSVGAPAPAPPLVPGADGYPTFGAGAKTIPVEVVSLPAGSDRSGRDKPSAPAAPPLAPGADGYPTFGTGAKTIPVEVVSLPAGSDRSGQERAIGNTLDKAADASSTAANGGKPIEATVKPDQITAKIDTLPPVSGEATVTVDNHHQITVTLNTEMLTAQVNAAANKAVAKIPLSSSGARPGAVSMPGAATTPGAK